MNLRDDDLNNLCIVADCISVCCTVNESELDFFYHASVGVYAIVYVLGYVTVYAFTCYLGYGYNVNMMREKVE